MDERDISSGINDNNNSQINCSQCGKPAVTMYGNKIPLCLTCFKEIEYLRQMEISRYIDFINFTQQQINQSLGFSWGPSPLMNNFYPTKIGTGPNINNIKIDRSTVGTVNSVVAGSLDNSINIMNSIGHEQISKAITELANSVLDANELNNEVKADIIEHLDIIAQQIITPKEKRSKSVIASVMTHINDLLKSILALSTMFDKLKILLNQLQ